MADNRRNGLAELGCWVDLIHAIGYVALIVALLIGTAKLMPILWRFLVLLLPPA